MTRAKRSKPVKAGLPPADARAIEDTAVHVMAAQRAGVHVIATSDKPTSSLTTSRIVALRSIGAFSLSPLTVGETPVSGKPASNVA